jgi:uncharacterized protein YndB with AHSA1/START domain
MERPDSLTLRLERSLAVPREEVYAACTEPERLAEWWGPDGFALDRLADRVRARYG